jgi:hypothetical protein
LARVRRTSLRFEIQPEKTYADPHIEEILAFIPKFTSHAGLLPGGVFGSGGHIGSALVDTVQ